MFKTKIKLAKERAKTKHKQFLSVITFIQNSYAFLAAIKYLKKKNKSKRNLFRYRGTHIPSYLDLACKFLHPLYYHDKHT